VYDLAIIGGGINGTGIARDAAGRGLSVLLIEQQDLAGATSSASTKLIHGGLRYLEHFQFRLVREALAEREVLLRAAPHIARPLRFVLPHGSGQRPWWMLRAGLFLYDRLGGRKLLPPTRLVDLRTDPSGVPLQPSFRRGLEYSDCWVDDARMVILNARDAAARGADIRTRTTCVAAHRDLTTWTIELDNGRTEEARVLVNATGPWVAKFLQQQVAQAEPSAVRLVKGSHIVVPRLFQHDRCYIFQNKDGRIAFAIPYERDFTLIGTTDEDFQGDPRDVAVSAGEEAYLLASVNAYLHTPVDPASIVWRYAGVRALPDDGKGSAQDATRDYTLELEGSPPILSVYGGKITTYRRLAEAALLKLRPYLHHMKAPWTANAWLPGGDFPWDGATQIRDSLLTSYPFLSRETAERFTRTYGTMTGEMLGEAYRQSDLGRVIGADLTEREVEWLVRTEWARTADDILWRRTKLGLRFDARQVAALEAALERV
jgi:glycerol-3-phosphate dehydrogenase